MGLWIVAYLTVAVRGVRSAEVTDKIARHLGRFRDWFTQGFGRERLAALIRIGGRGRGPRWLRR
jgi:hypothetical protein